MVNFKTNQKQNLDSKKFIIFFELSNNVTFLVGNNLKCHQINHENLTIEDLEKQAKFYSSHGARIAITKLWDKFQKVFDEENDKNRIIQATYQSLEYTKRHAIMNKNNELICNFR